MMSGEIFVQIASYRDPQLLPTIRDCVTKARHPDRLRFGICWQRDDMETLGEFERDPRFRILSVPYQESRGVCWARNRIQALYRGETYALQLDSHHRFIPDWDLELIEMLRLTGAEKPILTAYAPSFDPANEDAREHVPWRLGFDRFIPEGAVFFLPRSIDDHKDRVRPLRGRFFSAHFAFTLGSFCEEVKTDPHYYFHGEEINLAARAFTHGYDLFQPHKVVVWHEYTRSYRTKQWDDDPLWTRRNDESHRRNRMLFGMEETTVDFGEYGFGTRRTLREYEDYAGLNFRLKLAHPYTIRDEEPPNPHVYKDDEEWRENCLRDFMAVVAFDRALVGGEPDWDFWFVGVHERHGDELFRGDLRPREIDQVMRSGRVKFGFRYCAAERAETWTVWPHSPTRGWLEKITGPVNGTHVGGCDAGHGAP